MTSQEKRVEEIMEKLDVICKQADQYQINAGYPVGTRAKEILRTTLTTALEEQREEIGARVEFLETVIKDIKGYSPDGEIGTLCDQALSDITARLKEDYK